MRQIELLVDVVSELIFGKKGVSQYEQLIIEPSEQSQKLHTRIVLLFDEGDYNRAENELFEWLDTGDTGSLAAGVDLYARLNSLTDEELKKGGFSRGEVDDGLRELIDRFGINCIPDTL